MWLCSNQCDMYSSLPQPEHSGWTICEEGRYAIDWEAPEVVEKVKHTIQFLTKGCSCKKGCVSNKCGCRKRSSHCGSGCECQGCVNLPIEEAMANSSENEISDEEAAEEENDSNDSGEDVDMEIVTEDFFVDTIDMIIIVVISMHTYMFMQVGRAALHLISLA